MHFTVNLPANEKVEVTSQPNPNGGNTWFIYTVTTKRRPKRRK